MATKFPERLLEVAGNAAREIVLRTNPAEAQVALSLVVAYLCDRHGIAPETMTRVLVHNARQTVDDSALRVSVLEKMHNRALDKKILTPEIDPMIEKYPYRARVSDLPRKRPN